MPAYHRDNIKEFFLYAVIIACTVLLSKFIFEPKAIDSLGAKIVKLDNYGIENLGPIILYSSKKCSACAKLKKYLEMNNVEYYNYQIEKSPSEFEILHQNGINVVPVLFIKNNMIVGYSHDETHRLLKAYGFL